MVEIKVYIDTTAVTVHFLEYVQFCGFVSSAGPVQVI